MGYDFGPGPGSLTLGLPSPPGKYRTGLDLYRCPSVRIQVAHLAALTLRRTGRGLVLPLIFRAMSIQSNSQQLLEERAPKIARLDPITTLRVKRLSENAIIPTRGSSKAAGYDLSRCAEAPAFYSLRLQRD